MEKTSKNFELLVRALIIQNGKILLCQTKGRDYYFLPGGHVEYGETLSDALIRELKEEMGAKVLEKQFIGGAENLFDQRGEFVHEISFVFQTEIEGEVVEAHEGHIQFSWFSYEEFVQNNVLPPSLKEAIIHWIQKKESFFMLQRRDV